MVTKHFEISLALQEEMAIISYTDKIWNQSDT